MEMDGPPEASPLYDAFMVGIAVVPWALIGLVVLMDLLKDAADKMQVAVG